jgi:hypothetical protein
MREHPLGFAERRLLRVGRLKLVFHAWPPGSGEPDVHTHRFSFVSLVLRGALVERRYVQVPGTAYVVLDCPAGCDPDAIAPTGERCGLNVEATRLRRGLYWGRMGTRSRCCTLQCGRFSPNWSIVTVLRHPGS